MNPPPGIYDTLELVARDLYIKALQDIPLDVRAGLSRGLEAETAHHHPFRHRLRWP